MTAEQAKRQHLSIGEVLELLVEDFPDVTISKIRFLESKGLISPERTPSGYRRFYGSDVDRLKSILLLQREHYLPLDVIKFRLDNGGQPGPEIHSQLSLSFVGHEEIPIAESTNRHATPERTGMPDSLKSSFSSAETLPETTAAAAEMVNVTSLISRTPRRLNGKAAFADGAVEEANRGGERSLGTDGFDRQKEAKPNSDAGHAMGTRLLEEEKYAVKAASVALEVSSLSGVTVSKLAAAPQGSIRGDDTSLVAPKAVGMFIGAESAVPREREAGNKKELPAVSSGVSFSGQDYVSDQSERKHFDGVTNDKGRYASQRQAAKPAESRDDDAGLRRSAVFSESDKEPQDDQKIAPLAERYSLSVRDHASDVKPAENQVGLDSVKTTRGNPQFDLAHTMYSKEELLVEAEIDSQLFAELLEYGLISAKRVAGESVYEEKAVRVAALAASYLKFGIGPRHLRSLKHAAEREASMYQQSIVPLLRQRNPESRKKALDNIEVMTQLAKELKDCFLRIEIDEVLGGKTQ